MLRTVIIFWYLSQSKLIFRRILKLSLVKKVGFNFKIRFLIKWCIICWLSHLSSLKILMISRYYFRLINDWMLLRIFSDCGNNFIVLIFTIWKHTVQFFFSLKVLTCYWSFIYRIYISYKYYFLFVLTILAAFLWWNSRKLYRLA